MDKDRIKGSAEQGKGIVKEIAGKVVGDSKLEAEGKAERAKGKIRNAVGGLKDSDAESERSRGKPEEHSGPPISSRAARKAEVSANKTKIRG